MTQRMKMAKPIPIWERWKNDPKTAHKYYLLMFIAFIGVNFFILVGMILFFVLLYYRKG